MIQLEKMRLPLRAGEVPALLLALVVAAACQRHPQDSNNVSRRRQDAPLCSSCNKMKEQVKHWHLEAIKGDLLGKMGYESAPNVTARNLPPIPPHVLAEFDQGMMQSDQPQQFKAGFTFSEEEDDYHVKTERVFTFARPCKYEYEFLLALAAAGALQPVARRVFPIPEAELPPLSETTALGRN